MPIFFAGIATWLASFFAEKGTGLAYRLAIVASFILVFLAFMGVFVAASLTLLDGIVVSVPSEVTQVWGWFMPTNTGACLSAIVAARFIRFAFDFKLKIAETKSKIISNS